VLEKLADIQMPEVSASPPGSSATSATAAAHHFGSFVGTIPPTPNVVETFQVPLLKAKDILFSDLPNCEGTVSPFGSLRSGHCRVLTRQVTICTQYSRGVWERISLQIPRTDIPGCSRDRRR
jgi:hypothetical protein